VQYIIGVRHQDNNLRHRHIEWYQVEGEKFLVSRGNLQIRLRVNEDFETKPPAGWPRARVRLVHARDGETYIRSDADGDSRDNLENLPEV
jgi:hypothetical protein